MRFGDYRKPQSEIHSRLEIFVLYSALMHTSPTCPLPFRRLVTVSLYTGRPSARLLQIQQSDIQNMHLSCLEGSGQQQQSTHFSINYLTPVRSGRFRAKKGTLRFRRLLPENQGHNMALPVLDVPYSLDIGKRVLFKSCSFLASSGWRKSRGKTPGNVMAP